jgi:F-type H+-transporting ATPase subunit a
MQFLYSPLEQFEPIPFITIYLGNINLSITSITIMFIYLFFILVFFLNGYLFEPASSTSLVTSKNKEGSVSLQVSGDGSLLNKDVSLLTSSLTKEVSYFGFLVSRSATFYNFSEEKSKWISSSIESSSLRNRYSVIFYKGFYNLLSTQKVSFSPSFNYFSDIKAIILNFLATFTTTSKNLNNDFLTVKGSQTLYSFSTKSNRSVYDITFVPKINMFFFEAMYNFIMGEMIKNMIGSDKRAVSFFPVVFTIFIFILFANLGGLVPYSSTVTAYFVVTFTLALFVKVGVVINAFKTNGIKYIGHFLPGGVPGALIPFIIPIEVFSFTFRLISLPVRLFANMMAGHTLFAVLTGFGWSMVTAGITIAIVSPVPVITVFVLTALETFVAFVQAYVFTLLTCMYIEESMHS